MQIKNNYQLEWEIVSQIWHPRLTAEAVCLTEISESIRGIREESLRP